MAAASSFSGISPSCSWADPSSGVCFCEYELPSVYPSLFPLIAGLVQAAVAVDFQTALGMLAKTPATDNLFAALPSPLLPFLWYRYHGTFHTSPAIAPYAVAKSAARALI